MNTDKDIRIHIICQGITIRKGEGLVCRPGVIHLEPGILIKILLGFGDNP